MSTRVSGVRSDGRDEFGVLLIDEPARAAQPVPPPRPKSGTDTAIVLHQLDLAARKLIGKTSFSKAEFLSALEEAIDALTGEPADEGPTNAPPGDSVEGSEVVRLAERRMRADGIVPSTADQETVLAYYAEATAEQPKRELPVQGEDLVAVATVIAEERGQDPEDAAVFASCLEEAGRLQARAVEYADAQRLVRGRR
jgi:hypothetical protein